VGYPLTEAVIRRFGRPGVTPGRVANNVPATRLMLRFSSGCSADRLILWTCVTSLPVDRTVD
jgi:hypothetical protein